MENRCYLVDKKAVIKAYKEMVGMQREASIVSDESTKAKLELANHYHGIAQGFYNCLRTLDLIEEPMVTEFLSKQFSISNKVRELQEKELSGSAKPKELQLINISREV